MIYAFFLFVFVQKSFLTNIFFPFAEINLTTRGPLYTCLVCLEISENGYFWHQSSLEIHKFGLNSRSTSMSGVDKAVSAAGGQFLFKQAGHAQISFWIRQSLTQN